MLPSLTVGNGTGREGCEEPKAGSRARKEAGSTVVCAEVFPYSRREHGRRREPGTRRRQDRSRSPSRPGLAKPGDQAGHSHSGGSTPNLTCSALWLASNRLTITCFFQISHFFLIHTHLWGAQPSFYPNHYILLPSTGLGFRTTTLSLCAQSCPTL